MKWLVVILAVLVLAWASRRDDVKQLEKKNKD